MAFSVVITDRNETSTIALNFAIVDNSGVVSSTDINVDAYNTISSGTLQSALEHLADQSFRTTEAPSGSSLSEGDTWYDTDDEQLYVYRETSAGVYEWVPIIFGDPDSDTFDSGNF